MGNIQKRPDGKWRARYRDPGGKERSRHFERKLDAQRWLNEIEIAKSRGEWTDPALGKITVGTWSQTWLKGLSHLKPSTRTRYVLGVRCHILPTWQNVPLKRVTHGDVVTWVQDLADQELAPATIRYAYRIFSLMLDLAVRDRRIPSNPASGVRLPRVEQSNKRFLTVEQVVQLAEACGPHRLMVTFLAYTGLRWGEMAALRVNRLDFPRRRVNVVTAASEINGKIVVGTPKNHQHRAVPLPRFLAADLAEHVAHLSPDDLVFSAPKGGYLRNTNFRRRIFNAATESVGLAGFTPHELRHTAASLAVAAGANVKAIQRMLGHASAAMTLDIYAGLFAEDLDVLADQLDQMHRSASADSVRTEEDETDDPEEK
jgi:integrase